MTFAKPALAAAALLALAGCSATHIGDEWQCPLVQGTTCTTVAGADPMVPDETAEAEAPAVPLSPSPLYRPPDPDAPAAAPHAARSCEAGCGEGFDPFGWLSGWLARIAGEDDAPETGATAGVADAYGDSPPGIAVPSDPPSPGGADPAVSAVSPLPGAPEPPGMAATEGAEPGAPHPADPDSTAALPDAPFVPDTALRSAEVIGRIWIAPFVDADGHYREGSWVRAVLEPAGWRVR